MRFLLKTPIYAYRWLISPWLPANCRYRADLLRLSHLRPSIRTWRVLRGGWLAAKRLARCHPWGGSGYDPVPLERQRPTAAERTFPPRARQPQPPPRDRHLDRHSARVPDDDAAAGAAAAGTGSGRAARARRRDRRHSDARRQPSCPAGRRHRIEDRSRTRFGQSRNATHPDRRCPHRRVDPACRRAYRQHHAEGLPRDDRSREPAHHPALAAGPARRLLCGAGLGRRRRRDTDAGAGHPLVHQRPHAHARAAVETFLGQRCRPAFRAHLRPRGRLSGDGRAVRRQRRQRAGHALPLRSGLPLRHAGDVGFLHPARRAAGRSRRGFAGARL